MLAVETSWQVPQPFAQVRSLLTSPSDDTSVAVLSRTPSKTSLIFHETITSDNRQFGGVHPLTSIESHRKNIAPLISRAMKSLNKEVPDIVAATRGPGMRSCLSVGLDAVGGVSAALDRPFVGVHHMQAHMLTPRLVAALEGQEIGPKFPFLTLLVSGGHTMLLESRGLNEHKILADSMDIAVGDYIDKAARDILEDEVLNGPGKARDQVEGISEQPYKHVAYGKILEDYAFPKGAADYDYHPPGSKERKYIDTTTPGYYSRWNISLPLSEKGARNSKTMRFSFSGLGASIARVAPTLETVTEKRAFAAVAQTVAFEHVTSRIILALKALGEEAHKMQALVVSGGVASNSYLKHLMRVSLDAAGYEGLELLFPPPSLCTDNAAMIAWAASEMWESGWRTEWGVEPIAKWSLDPQVEGGILGRDGWVKREEE